MADWWSPLISASAGLCGVWLGAWLSRHKERWMMKRDVYVELLEGFQQMESAYRRLESGVRSGLPTADIEGLLAEIQKRIRNGDPLETFADVLRHRVGDQAPLALPALRLEVGDIHAFSRKALQDQTADEMAPEAEVGAPAHPAV